MPHAAQQAQRRLSTMAKVQVLFMRAVFRNLCREQHVDGRPRPSTDVGDGGRRQIRQTILVSTQRQQVLYVWRLLALRAPNAAPSIGRRRREYSPRLADGDDEQIAVARRGAPRLLVQVWFI